LPAGRDERAGCHGTRVHQLQVIQLRQNALRPRHMDGEAIELPQRQRGALCNVCRASGIQEG
jgi:hypothetical protein